MPSDLKPRQSIDDYSLDMKPPPPVIAAPNKRRLVEVLRSTSTQQQQQRKRSLCAITNRVAKYQTPDGTPFADGKYLFLIFQTYFQKMCSCCLWCLSTSNGSSSKICLFFHVLLQIELFVFKKERNRSPIGVCRSESNASFIGKFRIFIFIIFVISRTTTNNYRLQKLLNSLQFEFAKFARQQVIIGVDCNEESRRIDRANSLDFASESCAVSVPHQHQPTRSW